jgi:hypothetical protein
VVLLLLAAPAAHAEAAPPPDDAKLAEAKALFRRGVELLDVEDAEHALLWFVRSRATVPSGRNTANAAICLERLGRYDEALAMFEELYAKYISDLGEADRTTILPVMQALRGKVGNLAITADVDGASVEVDGRARGRLPLAGRLRVNAGKHVVRVLKDGYEAVEVTVDVAGGGSTPVDVKLSAPQDEDEKAPPSRPAPAAPAPAKPLGPRVYIRSDDPSKRLTLYRVDLAINGVGYVSPRYRRDPTDHSLPMSEVGEVSITVERAVCVAPCDQEVLDDGHEFFLAGEGITPSSRFLLGPYNAVHINASPGSSTLRGAGAAFTTIGTIAAVLGTCFLPVATDGNRTVAGVSGGLLGSGGAALAAGIPLLVTGSTKYSIGGPEVAFRF